MTISRQDVHALSSGPAPDGVPLAAAEADRVAAVLNLHATHRALPEAAVPRAGALSLGGRSAPRSGATTPRDRLLGVMARAGYASEEIEAAAAALPELVDLRVDHAVLARFSLTPGKLMERMGSSP